LSAALKRKSLDILKINKIFCSFIKCCGQLFINPLGRVQMGRQIIFWLAKTLSLYVYTTISRALSHFQLIAMFNSMLRCVESQ